MQVSPCTYSVDAGIVKRFPIDSSTLGIGSSMGPNLAIAWPSLSITNLVKFHLIALNRVPPCLFFR